MSKITLNEYKKAIRTQYEKKKIEDITGILMNPSPAQLRNLCLIFFDESLSNNDETTMKLFFNVKEEESLRKSIEKCEISRFRPIRSFLLGEKNSEDRMRIEMAAIIVDYNPRPYRRYLQIGDTKEIEVGISQRIEQKEIIIDKVDSGGLIKNDVITKNWKRIKRVGFIIMILISLSFMTYTVKDIIFPTKECMQWKENHYEAVDCSNEKLGIGQLNLIVPVDEQIMKLNKLDSKVALVFFENGLPIVWYYKKDGEIELFNQPGFYPETAKQLKPITNYIIQKYKLKGKD
nr:hypothetical protein [uncultured Flavobacterium sp.]